MVDEDIRKYGHGSKLLLEIEQVALEKKCDFIKVETLSVQALGFYEKQGYKVFGSIDNVGRDHKHYYLKKDLINHRDIQKSYLKDKVVITDGKKKSN